MVHTIINIIIVAAKEFLCCIASTQHLSKYVHVENTNNKFIFTCSFLSTCFMNNIARKYVN